VEEHCEPNVLFCRKDTRGDTESYKLVILASIAVETVMFIIESNITESPDEHGLL